MASPSTSVSKSFIKQTLPMTDLPSCRGAQRLLHLRRWDYGFPAGYLGSCARTEAGVTLVELMAVVAIIGLIAALAIPNYTRSMARATLKQALTELHGNLNMSRMAAMNRNTTITVTLAVVGGRVTATFTDPNSTSAQCLGDTRRCVLPTQTMPAEITGVAALLGGTAQVLPVAINFNSLGLLVGAGTSIQTVRLTNSKGTIFEIQITPAGKARWCTTSPCTT